MAPSSAARRRADKRPQHLTGHEFTARDVDAVLHSARLEGLSSLPSNPPRLPPPPSESITISRAALQGLLQTFGAGIAQHIPQARGFTAADVIPPSELYAGRHPLPSSMPHPRECHFCPSLPSTARALHEAPIQQGCPSPLTRLRQCIPANYPSADVAPTLPASIAAPPPADLPAFRSLHAPPAPPTPQILVHS
ncbi:hypothetical protein C0989_009577 [Termitomyces sp. Mn162]|nr:hypothetical protein C0989_009577 [Termitomyces sp. Mn162]